MQIEVKIPQLSESVAEATLVSWHKREGQAVKRDENLIDIETDKVVMELPAPADGVLARIIKADGGTVTSGEVIATIDTTAAATATAPAPAAPAGSVPAKAPAASTAAAAPMSPAAAKIAVENNVTDVVGTGRGGRITKEDVVNKLSAAQG
ncbi:MAG: biotin/lipoyl-containing protein, partial [Betaproteobacteria bacterium]